MKWENWEAHPDDRRFIHSVLKRAPTDFWPYIRQKYNRLLKFEGRRAANTFMLELEDLFKETNIHLAMDDNNIRDRANKEAKVCSQIIHACRDEEKSFSLLSSYVAEMRITPPEAKTIKGVLARYRCKKWWRRKLRILHGQTLEKIALKLNIVNKHSDIYVSECAVKRRRSQRNRNRAILEELEAVNELDDAFTLQELAEKSVSNPRLRRAELMTRIAGNEQIADDLKHVGEFYTLTCPSRLNKSGKPNPNYDGTTPKEAQFYLRKIWSHIRTALSNRSIPIYGIRVAEPHHDGTPHWHFLLFIEPHNRQLVRSIFRQYALKIDGDEKGAEKYRFKAVAIDKNRGTAAGYVAKYISKNIDGYGLEADLYGHEAKTSAERIDAYASTWRIRQFQFFGNPPVTIWRELRRIRESDKPLIAQAAKAADNGDWAGFIRVMGGPCTKKKMMPIAIMRIWSDKPGMYDEPIGFVIVGVESDEDSVITRLHVWSVEYKPKPKPPDSTIFRTTEPAIFDILRNALDSRPLEFCQ